jgi:hypothetical protein
MQFELGPPKVSGIFEIKFTIEQHITHDYSQVFQSLQTNNQLLNVW